MLRRADLIRRAGIALAVGFPAAMMVTALAALAFHATGLLKLSDIVKRRAGRLHLRGGAVLLHRGGAGRGGRHPVGIVLAAPAVLWLNPATRRPGAATRRLSEG